MDKDFLRMMAAGISDDEPQLSKEEQLEKIRAFIAVSEQLCPFKVGDVVTQKSGELKRYKFPRPGDPAVVIETKETGFVANANGSEDDKNDITIVVMKHRPLVFSVESFRFEPYKEEVKE